MDIRPISASEARTVRQEVLRPGRPESEVIYPFDDSATTTHLGAYDGSRLIGVASFFPEACPAHDGIRAWRLRGMAVVSSLRGRGLGGELLQRGIELADRAGVDVVWCNGRVPARSFYERHGFAAVGEEFSVPVTGPHYLFVRHMSR